MEVKKKKERFVLLNNDCVCEILRFLTSKDDFLALCLTFKGLYRHIQYIFPKATENIMFFLQEAPKCPKRYVSNLTLVFNKFNAGKESFRSDELDFEKYFPNLLEVTFKNERVRWKSGPGGGPSSPCTLQLENLNPALKWKRVRIFAVSFQFNLLPRNVEVLWMVSSSVSNDSIYGHRNLKSLFLSRENTVSIRGLPRLRNLEISRDYSSFCPSELQNRCGLESFYAFRGEQTKTLVIEDLPELENLRIIHAVRPRKICRIPNIKNIELIGSSFNGITLEDVGLRKLERLKVTVTYIKSWNGSNQINIIGLAKLHHFSVDLRHIRTSRAECTMGVLGPGLKSLRELDLFRAGFDHASIDPIHFPSLENIIMGEIRMMKNEITPESFPIKWFRQFTNLRRVKIERLIPLKQNIEISFLKSLEFLQLSVIHDRIDQTFSSVEIGDEEHDDLDIVLSPHYSPLYKFSINISILECPSLSTLLTENSVRFSTNDITGEVTYRLGPNIPSLSVLKMEVHEQSIKINVSSPSNLHLDTLHVNCDRSRISMISSNTPSEFANDGLPVISFPTSTKLKKLSFRSPPSTVVHCRSSRNCFLFFSEHLKNHVSNLHHLDLSITYFRRVVRIKNKLCELPEPPQKLLIPNLPLLRFLEVNGSIFQFHLFSSTFSGCPNLEYFRVSDHSGFSTDISSTYFHQLFSSVKNSIKVVVGIRISVEENEAFQLENFLRLEVLDCLFVTEKTKEISFVAKKCPNFWKLYVSRKSKYWKPWISKNKLIKSKCFSVLEDGVSLKKVEDGRIKIIDKRTIRNEEQNISNIRICKSEIPFKIREKSGKSDLIFKPTSKYKL